jgi:DNA-binding transcriptional ArsR family regulator
MRGPPTSRESRAGFEAIARTLRPHSPHRTEALVDTGLNLFRYFDKYKIMKKEFVLSALAALAQETRLEAFRRLVRAGGAGLPAGALAEELSIAPATLSFHLKELRNAGLVTSVREGRSIRYAPDFSVIGGVVAYLGENCCQGGFGSASGSGAAKGRT